MAIAFSSDTRLREDEAVPGTTRKQIGISIPVPARFHSFSKDRNITLIKTKFYGQGNIQIHVPGRYRIAVISFFSEGIAMAVRDNEG
ncbi:MAG: hypothetical protein SOR65_10080 [Odoribacter sp.]|nr:hypothetical protein [Odoribacter sp.]